MENHLTSDLKVLGKITMNAGSISHSTSNIINNMIESNENPFAYGEIQKVHFVSFEPK